MIDLDDVAVIKEIDKEDMLGTLERFPEQCEEAVEIALKLGLASLSKNPDSIVILGMGGSGICGDIIETVVGAE